jgi:hypothetical protein
LERDKAHRDDVERARWAAASHSAHSSAVLRSAIPTRS